ncbi:MAG: hypothetical protein GXO71_05440 [Caldiserica bacterium]|nr:hypothetical protein [Caldisericota bacterium]
MFKKDSKAGIVKENSSLPGFKPGILGRWIYRAIDSKVMWKNVLNLFLKG